MAIRSRLLLITKTPKLASNEPRTFGIGHHFGSCIACPADITHKIQSSVQLQVDGAASQAERLARRLALAGATITDGTTANTVSGHNHSW